MRTWTRHYWPAKREPSLKLATVDVTKHSRSVTSTAFYFCLKCDRCGCEYDRELGLDSQCGDMSEDFEISCPGRLYEIRRSTQPPHDLV
jgi:hypothetical protein